MVGLKQGCTLKSGKYKIEKTLGQGSFGITYLATTRISVNGQLGKIDVNVNVTIKEFFMSDLNSRATDGTSVARTSSTLVKNYRNKFKKEAENLAKLHHPNIVKVIEVFDENNTTYYVMEYVEGGSLDDYIKSKGRLTEEEALKCTIEIADALSYMHQKHMIHLDLKPKNIMRNSKGHLYLIDFGLSKQYDEKGEPESSTSIGLGTPGYAPLEQASYKQDGTLPITLDIYALGASLFKMLTGMTPPESSSILNDGFPLSFLQKAGISAKTISIVEKAMASMKRNRFQSIDYMSNAIEESIKEINISSTINGHKNIVYEEEQTSYEEIPVNEAKTNSEYIPINKGKYTIKQAIGAEGFSNNDNQEINGSSFSLFRWLFGKIDDFKKRHGLVNFILISIQIISIVLVIICSIDSVRWFTKDGPEYINLDYELFGKSDNLFVEAYAKSLFMGLPLSFIILVCNGLILNMKKKGLICLVLLSILSVIPTMFWGSKDDGLEFFCISVGSILLCILIYFLVLLIPYRNKSVWNMCK